MVPAVGAATVLVAAMAEPEETAELGDSVATEREAATVDWPATVEEEAMEAMAEQVAQAVPAASAARVYFFPKVQPWLIPAAYPVV